MSSMYVFTPKCGSPICRNLSCSTDQYKTRSMYARVRACAAGDGAICSKNRKIVPYHGANHNTRNGARLRSPSPIIAPDHS